MISSIIHHLQGKGSRDLFVANVNRAFTVVPVGFVEKITNRPAHVLPVFSLSTENALSLVSRFDQIHAESGLVTNDESLPVEEINAATSLLTEERLSVAVPASRFALEIATEHRVHAIVIEALKERETPLTGEVRYTPSEIRGMKLRECNYLQMFCLWPRHGVHEHEILLHSLKISVPMRELSRTPGLPIYESVLGGHEIEIQSGPPGLPKGRPLGPAVVFNEIGEQEKQDVANIVNFFAEVAFDLLWVLERDPRLIRKDIETFPRENATRRALKRPSFSPVQTITIDQTELRRAEFEQASIITKALAEQGSYSIPGLVLVGPHERKSTGKEVQAYARCADPAVRDEATMLLRRVFETGDAATKQELAEFVNAFGAERTRARLGLSQLHKVALV